MDAGILGQKPFKIVGWQFASQFLYIAFFCKITSSALCFCFQFMSSAVVYWLEINLQREWLSSQYALLVNGIVVVPHVSGWDPHHHVITLGVSSAVRFIVSKWAQRE